MVTKLEIRNQHSVGEERCTHAGAQGQHELDTLSTHDPEALEVGVVDGPHGALEQLAELLIQRHPVPELISEIGCVLRDAALDHTREAERDTPMRWQGASHVADQPEHGLGGCRCRCRPSNRFGDGHPLIVERERLDATTTDIDRQRAHRSESFSLR